MNIHSFTVYQHYLSLVTARMIYNGTVG